MLLLSFARSTHWARFVRLSNSGLKAESGSVRFRPRFFRLIAETQLEHPLPRARAGAPSLSPALDQNAGRREPRTGRKASTTRRVLCHCRTCLERRQKDHCGIEFQLQIAFLGAGIETGRST